MSDWFSKYNRTFPVATLIINLLGSSLIGVLAGIDIEKGTGFHMFTVIGAMGAFTTFSTFAVEALELMVSKDYRLLWIYTCFTLVGSTICCMVWYYLINNIV